MRASSWLLRSPYRTLDPAKADFFFIPAYLSLGAPSMMPSRPCPLAPALSPLPSRPCPRAPKRGVREDARTDRASHTHACASCCRHGPPHRPLAGFYDFEFGLYWLSPRGHGFLRSALSYVATTWPYYNRSRGADHLLVMTNDKGATFIRGSVPALEKVNLITQWGW